MPLKKWTQKCLTQCKRGRLRTSPTKGKTYIQNIWSSSRLQLLVTLKGATVIAPIIEPNSNIASSSFGPYLAGSSNWLYLTSTLFCKGTTSCYIQITTEILYAKFISQSCRIVLELWLYIKFNFNGNIWKLGETLHSLYLLWFIKWYFVSEYSLQNTKTRCSRIDHSC